MLGSAFYDVSAFSTFNLVGLNPPHFSYLFVRCAILSGGTGYQQFLTEVSDLRVAIDS